jgi:hypothetical protein
MEPLAIRHDAVGRRFLAESQGRTAILEYRLLEEGVVDFASTFVPHELRGRRIGTRLVLHALAEARSRGLRVRPSCWFVRVVMDAHPEFRDLRVA